MKYRYVGNSGLQISEICFGTQTFGWNIGKKASFELADLYVERGGNYFDTADSYNEGASERILGSWLKEKENRQDYVIGTKVFFPVREGVNNCGASRKHILESVDTSLSRLGTDYIDLLQIHCFDAMTPIEETMRALDDLIRMGKVCYIGASNFTPSQLMKAQMISKAGNMSPFLTLQLEYSLLVRSPEWELLPMCQQEGIGTLAWSPLSGGWLTGKYRRDQRPPADSRVGRGDRWDDSADQRGTEQAYDIVEELLKISREISKPVTQISLNWMIAQERVTAPLIGARTVEQLEQNLDAATWELEEQYIDRLNAVSAIPLPSPYSFIENYTRR